MYRKRNCPREVLEQNDLKSVCICMMLSLTYPLAWDEDTAPEVPLYYVK